ELERFTKTCLSLHQKRYIKRCRFDVAPAKQQRRQCFPGTSNGIRSESIGYDALAERGRLIESKRQRPLTVAANTIPALQGGIGRHHYSSFVPITVPEQVLVFCREERPPEPTSGSDFADVGRSVGNRTRILDFGTRIKRSDPVMIGIGND